MMFHIRYIGRKEVNYMRFDSVYLETCEKSHSVACRPLVTVFFKK